jgi:hypothetical protein
LLLAVSLLWLHLAAISLLRGISLLGLRLGLAVVSLLLARLLGRRLRLPRPSLGRRRRRRLRLRLPLLRPLLLRLLRLWLGSRLRRLRLPDPILRLLGRLRLRLGRHLRRPLALGRGSLLDRRLQQRQVRRLLGLLRQRLAGLELLRLGILGRLMLMGLPGFGILERGRFGRVIEGRGLEGRLLLLGRLRGERRPGLRDGVRGQALRIRLLDRGVEQVRQRGRV